MAKDSMKKEENGKEKILAAIRRAGEELGRAPSRGELRRITGVSYYRVLSEFPTLREAVRAAGLEPNPKGEKISTEDLLVDWKRVAEKLGRRPSRAEYVREGRYSAGALTVRFGSWSGISTAKDAKGAKKKPVSRELTRRTRINQKPDRSNHNRSNHKGHEEAQREIREVANGVRRQGLEGDKAIAMTWTEPMAAVPAPLVGMRRVTVEVAQMVVNTLLAPGNWQLDRSNQLSAFSVQPNQEQSRFTTEGTEEHGGGKSRELTRRSRICEEQVAPEITAQGVRKEGDLDPSLAVNALPFDSAQGSGLRPSAEEDDRWRRADFPPHRAKSARVGDPGFTARGLYKDRAVMGEPFDRSPMTNAPVNELGVMVLFGMVAARLGLQVESVQGKFPDCVAKRLVAPGKWQHLRIEFEYESRNFKLHGHDPKGCDALVCWRHNWKECPEEIEVVELGRIFGM